MRRFAIGKELMTMRRIFCIPRAHSGNKTCTSEGMPALRFLSRYATRKLFSKNFEIFQFSLLTYPR